MTIVEACEIFGGARAGIRAGRRSAHDGLNESNAFLLGIRDQVRLAIGSYASSGVVIPFKNLCTENFRSFAADELSFDIESTDRARRDSRFDQRPYSAPNQPIAPINP